MRVAFFTDSYLPTADGVAHVVSALARALVRAGHEARVFTPNPKKGAPAEETELDGVPVLRVRSLPVPRYAEYRWALLPYWRLLSRQVGEWADVVHLHTPGAMGAAGFLTARGRRKPVVGTFHTNLWAASQAWGGGPGVRLFFRASWWFTRGLYWRCDATTAPTPTARDDLVRASRKAYARPIEVIPNGIELDRFRPGVTRPDWRLRCGLPEGPLVTYLGRLTVDKGVHRFLDAVEAVAAQRTVSAIVGGVGPEEPAVIARVRTEPSLERSVRYVGRVAEEEKAALLSQSDLFVLPSTSDTASVAVLEAMACGTAPIVSDIGGPADIVHDRVTGRVVHLGRAGELTEVIAEELADPAGRHRMGAAAVGQVRTSASIDETAHRFIALYESLQSRGARATRFAG